MKSLVQPIPQKSIFISSALLVLLTGIGTIGMSTFGWGAFILAPIAAGLLVVFLCGTKKELSGKKALKYTCLTWLCGNLLFFFLGMEGIVCILMATPMTLPCTMIGGLIGYFLQKRSTKASTLTTCIFIVLSPFFMGAESVYKEPTLHEVTSEIIIDAPIEKVWDIVIEFPPLDEPEEFIFRAGISYPTHATMTEADGKLIRECHFNTGPFVEPITEMNKPYKLAFDVTEQPAPMVSTRPFKYLEPPLDAYLKSKKGQFVLKETRDGRVKLIGTTWYEQELFPAAYWGAMTDSIIHQIHVRVLQHIKSHSNHKLVR
jgi:hypothetical protein